MDCDENLLGYLMNALDPATHRAVAEHLGSHPESRRRLERMRGMIQPLGCDRDVWEPPAGLADRTLARIAAQPEFALPRAPRTPNSPPERRAWRRADVLVAASIILLVLAVGVPWLMHLRWVSSQRVECQNNLRGLHQSLVSYSQNRHGELPKVEERPPRNVAAIFIPLLRDAGVLTGDVRLACSGQPARPLACLSLQHVETMSPEELHGWSLSLANTYAYTLGYRDAQGRLQGLRRDPAQPRYDLLPILADSPQRPSSTCRPQAAVGHPGGVNVLYLGGNVRFCTTTAAGVDGDELYVNRLGCVAAGINPWDTVLGVGADHP